MPVIAVGVAAIAVGVAVQVGTTLAIIAAVGATIAAIGAVTGVKELQIAGAVIGLVGGIGALAQSAGMFAAEGVMAAEAAVEAGAAGTMYGFEGAGTAMTAGEATVGGIVPAAGEVTITDIINSVTGEMNTPGAATLAAEGGNNALSGVASNIVSPDVIPDAGSFTADAAISAPGQEVATNANSFSMPGQEGLLPTGEVVQGDSINVATNPATSPTNSNSLLNGGVDPNVPPTGTTAPTGTEVSNNILNGGAGTNVTGLPGSSLDATGYQAAQNAVAKFGSAAADGSQVKGVFSKILDFVSKPGVGTLLSGTVQAGGAFLAGATDTLKPAQVDALKAQAEANQAAANIARTQQSNIQQPLPVARRMEPQAQAVPQQVTGSNSLMNGPPAPPRAPAVTGVPA